MKLIVVLSILSFSLYSNALGTFDVGKYIEECGGKVYPSCDSAELNQLTIYKEAERLAIESNKKIGGHVDEVQISACEKLRLKVHYCSSWRHRRAQKATLPLFLPSFSSCKTLPKSDNIDSVKSRQISTRIWTLTLVTRD